MTRPPELMDIPLLHLKLHAQSRVDPFYTALDFALQYIQQLEPENKRLEFVIERITAEKVSEVNQRLQQELDSERERRTYAQEACSKLEPVVLAAQELVDAREHYERQTKIVVLRKALEGLK